MKYEKVRAEFFKFKIFQIYQNTENIFKYFYRDFLCSTRTKIEFHIENLIPRFIFNIDFRFRS